MSNLLLPERLGCQVPRVSTLPPAIGSEGKVAIELAEHAGLHLDPWQQLVLNNMLRYRADMKWSALEFGLLVARQNGKGSVLEARELYALFVANDPLILHSAHEFKTAAEAFLRIKTLIENTDDLIRLCKRPRTSHGEESIELLRGSGGRPAPRLRFVARSRSSGRGFSGDTLILDEAQELDADAIAAAMPTLSARTNPQITYTGTVPEPKNDSAHWQSLRDRGRKGNERRLGWMEWSPEELPEGERYDLAVLKEDMDVLAAVNPGLGIRLSWDFVIDVEKASMADLAYARERLSLWDDATTETIVPVAAWRAAADEDCKAGTKIALAVDCTPNLEYSVVSVASLRPDRLVLAEIIERRRGTDWVPGRIKELVDEYSPVATVLHPGSPAGALKADLEEEGVVLTTVTGQEYAQACGHFVGLVTGAKAGKDLNGDPTPEIPPRFRHLDHDLLNAAVMGATKRETTEGAYVWNRRDTTVDLSPLVAVTLACHGLRLAEEDPEVDVWGFWE